MTDHDALLRVIIEHPDEDTPRLVFADWLDEHADAFPAPGAMRQWAAFIRDDIAMSLRDEYDPQRLRWQLIEKPQREEEGWARDTWPPVPPWAVFAGEPLFRRGFPWAITVPASDAPPAVTASDVAAPVECVRFVRGGLPAAEAVRASAWRDRLRAVEFDYRGAVSPMDVLARLAPAALNRLAFLNNSITAAEARALISSPLFDRLGSFRSTRAAIGTAVAESLVREGARSALRELHIVGGQVQWPALRALLSSPAVAGLRALSFGGDLIASPMKYAAIADLVAPELRSLDLSDDAPRAEAIEALVMSPIIRGLRQLDLSRSSLNRDRTRLLAGGAFDELRILRLYGNSAGNDGVVALARSPHLARLLVLDLGFSQVGDEGILAILESPWVEGLVRLNVIGSPASAETKELLKARMGDRVRL